MNKNQESQGFNNNNNRTISNSFLKFKKLISNKTKNKYNEENRDKQESPNTFRKSSFKCLSKNKERTSSNKKKEKLKNYFGKVSKLQNAQKNYYMSIKNKNIILRNNNSNNLIKGLDSINNISTDIISKKNSRINTQNSNSINKINFNKLFFPINKNAINFIDRNKLKSTKTINLRLFEKFEEELIKMNDNKKNARIQINSNNYLDSDIFFIYSSLKTLPEIKNEKIYKKILKTNNNKLNKNNNNNDNKDKFQKIRKEIKNLILNQNFRKTKYSLKKLMDLNPYHSVPKNVKYCNLVEIKNISEQLSYVSGIVQTRGVSCQPHFFKRDINFENNKNFNSNLKVIDSVTVTYNNNYASNKGELVWRILSKLTKKFISSSFRQACVFQGYSELWKYYSLLLEKMLVNYSAFKWFIIKNKYMEKNVFTEFLQYMDINIKKNKLFPDKVYLLFDYNGNDKINIKIFYFIMELISNSSNFLDKINFLCELFEDNNKQNYINIIEMQEILRSMILHENYKKDYNHLHEIIKNEFNLDKIESDNLITKSQLFDFLLKNEFFKKLIILFKNQFKNAYYYYNEEIINSFNSTVRNVKKFLNEHNEVSQLCKHDILNYEKILNSVQNKRKTIDKNKKLIESFE